MCLRVVYISGIFPSCRLTQHGGFSSLLGDQSHRAADSWRTLVLREAGTGMFLWMEAGGFEASVDNRVRKVRRWSEEVINTIFIYSLTRPLHCGGDLQPYRVSSGATRLVSPCELNSLQHFKHKLQTQRSRNQPGPRCIVGKPCASSAQ